MMDKKENARPSRILVVEDEGIIALRLERLLTGLGYEVTGMIPTGEQALQSAEARPPDLVLMDIKLAGELDGVETAVQIQARFDVPIVYLSAHPEQTVMERAKRTQPYGFLSKPVRDQELRATVETALYKHRMEARLRESEEKFRALTENSPDVIARFDRQCRHLYVNPAICRYVDLTPKDYVKKMNRELGFSEEQSKIWASHIRHVFETGEPCEYEFEFEGLQGRTIFDTRLTPEFGPDGQVRTVLSVARDVTERKRVESVTQARLRIAEASITESSKALMQMTLDEIETLTGSKIGLYHLLLNDQETISLQAWSTNTLENTCQVEGQDNHYPVSEAGVWVDCLREREPVIHNDYAALPHRKGMPPDHTPVIRELVFPVMRGNRVVAILGVGNKPTDYDQGDVEIISQLGDFSWEIVERKRAEEALRESEHKLRSIIEQSPSGIVLCDEQGGIVEWNAAQERVSGIDEDKALGQFMWDVAFQMAPEELCTPQAYERTCMAMQNLFRTGQPAWPRQVQEQVIQRPDGTRRVVETEVFSIKTDKGFMLCSITHDVTERKQVKEALQASEEKYRGLVEQSLQGMVIAQNNPVRLAFVSQPMQEITGFSPEELKNLGPRQLSELIHPQHRDAFFKNFRDRIQGKDVTPQREYRLVHKSGADRWVELYSSRIEYEGAPATQTIFLDITERKRAEEALRESEHRLDRMLQTLVDGMVRVNVDGEITYANPAAERILQVRRDAIRGRYYNDREWRQIDEDGNPFPLEQLPLALALGQKKEVEGLEHGIEAPNGETKWLSINAAPLLDENDRLYGAIASFRDITEQKQAQRQLEAALREKEVLLKEIHHRVKNNLSIVAGLLDLQSETAEGQRARQAFRESQSRVYTMARIHEHLYRSSDLSRIDMADYILNLASYLKQSYAVQDVDLEVHVDDVSLTMDAAIPCGLVINELVTNALQHAFPADRREPGRNRIDVRLYKDRDRWTLEVSDNGVGLPQDLDLQNLSSLGIKIADLLATQLGGSVQWHSEGGTTFSLTFPTSR